MSREDLVGENTGYDLRQEAHHSQVEADPEAKIWHQVENRKLFQSSLNSASGQK